MTFEWEWPGPDLDVKVVPNEVRIECKCKRGHCFHVKNHFKGKEMPEVVHLADTVGIMCCKCKTIDRAKVVRVTPNYVAGFTEEQRKKIPELGHTCQSQYDPTCEMCTWEQDHDGEEE